MKKLRVINSYTIGFFTIAVIVFLYFVPIDFINQLELKTFDLRFKIFQETIPSQNIVIVTIDNKSEDKIGRFPWSRDTYAKVIDNLNKWGAKVIGIDVLFSMAEDNPLSEVLNKTDLKDRVSEDLIEEYRKKFDNDKILTDSIKKAGNVVLGYYFLTEGDEQVKHITEAEKQKAKRLISKAQISLVSSGVKGDEKFLLRRGYGIETSIEQISRACKNYGFLNIFPDSDGVLRKVTFPMKYEHEKDWYASFPLQILKNYFDENIQLGVSNNGISALALGEKIIPVDASGALFVDYSVSSQSFPTESFVDVMTGTVDNPAKFKDKIVLIGITDPGLVRDTWPTPTETVVPGIKIHAQTIDTVLNNRFISYARTMMNGEFVYSSDGINILNLLAIILLGAILIFAIPKVSQASYGAYISLLLVAGYSFAGFYLFHNMKIRLNMFYPLSSIALVYTTQALYRALTTERKAREIRGAFQTYVPPQIVDELIKNPEKLKLGGERKTVSILYSDVKGFTTISEKLSPEELVEFMNNYLTPMSDIVFKYEGTLDKYIGDAVLAFYGAPLPQEDHPLRVVLSALDMISALKELRKKLKEENKPSIDVGIGINTGEVSVGNMGSKMRLDYTIMGDNVNLTQRIEELTRIYKNNILLSEYTYQKIKENIVCREIDEVTVRGKTQGVKIYEPICRKEEITPEIENIVKHFEAGLKLYKSGEFSSAGKEFSQVLQIVPEDGPSKYYLEKCRQIK
ncbi:MAG: adenylate/guanylate cyclase domain-containing protein [Candidatus Omnitrophica bacterium]|nr:adenylate/guanylate cyclase domain-containing protein [Candidatus Omnitrophota bacterium]MBU1048117.1 adenylate/guanylate cyclase domain-containing protein [Candidatus Omnitrophota bacterium]MBU1889207.1 adenylate/guanylate cyclase domain-containing protein [Candidatus Omnitrophota bacterium]